MTAARTVATVDIGTNTLLLLIVRRNENGAAEILADEELREVRDRAKALLGTGLTAGSGYGEVWIRDLNTFIELALQVNEAKGIRQVFHHGAYELIGVHLDLLESVAGATSTEFLLPTEIEGPAFGYAARFVTLLKTRGASVTPTIAAKRKGPP